MNRPALPAPVTELLDEAPRPAMATAIGTTSDLMWSGGR